MLKVVTGHIETCSIFHLIEGPDSLDHLARAGEYHKLPDIFHDS